MRAWRIHEYGAPLEALRLDEVDPPDPPAGQVRIAVDAIGLNFPDNLMCRGLYQIKPPMPFTPGGETAGRVVAVGDGVDPALLGRRMVTSARFADGCGSYAEQTLSFADALCEIPDDVSATDAAAMHIAFQTAHVGLHRRGALRSGETLLVLGAAGVVGAAALQLGKAAGARVIAIATGDAKTAACRALGADHVLDARNGQFVEAVKDLTAGRGADVVFDPVGGDAFDEARRCVAFEGRMLVIGFASGRIADAPTNHALLKNYSVVGVHWNLYTTVDPAVVREAHVSIMGLYRAGSIRPFISHQITFAEIPHGATAVVDRMTIGKIVCAIGGGGRNRESE